MPYLNGKYVEDCGARKHAYKFLGNQTFKTVHMGVTGTSVHISQNAVYECQTCGKVRRGPTKRGAPNEGIPANAFDGIA